jgi:hypothetical protein
VHLRTNILILRLPVFFRETLFPAFGDKLTLYELVYPVPVPLNDRDRPGVVCPVGEVSWPDPGPVGEKRFAKALVTRVQSDGDWKWFDKGFLEYYLGNASFASSQFCFNVISAIRLFIQCQAMIRRHTALVATLQLRQRRLFIISVC